MSSIVTPKQRDRLIRREDETDDAARRLNDFYVRKSLQKWLDSIEDIQLVLKTLPQSQIEKLLKDENVYGLYRVVEKFVEMKNPAPIAAPDENEIRHVYRHFRVDMSGQLPGVDQATVSIDVSYVPTDEEIKFFGNLTWHLFQLQQIYESNERPSEILTPKELDEKVAGIVKGRPYTAKVVGLMGSPTEETKENIMAGKPLTESGLPDITNIDPKSIGLKESKRED